jgi:hypothetical protein
MRALFFDVGNPWNLVTLESTLLSGIGRVLRLLLPWSCASMATGRVVVPMASILPRARLARTDTGASWKLHYLASEHINLTRSQSKTAVIPSKKKYSEQMRQIVSEKINLPRSTVPELRTV